MQVKNYPGPMIAVGVLAALTIFVVTGCGGGGSSSGGGFESNQEKIEANAGAEKANGVLEAELLTALERKHSFFDEQAVGLENLYEVSGGTCETHLHVPERCRTLRPGLKRVGIS
jgi:hypothetical protein